MKKVTLKFTCLSDVARFAKYSKAGYLMNTTNFTLTGKFPAAEIKKAKDDYSVILMDTTDFVYSYQ